MSQDEQDAKRRKKLQRKAEREIERLLRNPDGLARLRDLSDEEWEAAVVADEVNGENAA